jgi:hypothetical protein
MSKKMTDQRKATDVLIGLEKKIEDLLSYQKNQDLLIKKISQQLSDINKSISDLKSSFSDQSAAFTAELKVEPSKELKTIPGLKPGIVIGKFKGEEKNTNESLENNDDSNQTSLKEQNKKRGTRQVNSNKPMPIKQSLKYPDGRPLAMAKIDIYDVDKINLISSVKSSILGEWVESLLPEKYIINIFKKASGDKPEVSLEYMLDIPNSTTPLKLDDLIIPST